MLLFEKAKQQQEQPSQASARFSGQGLQTGNAVTLHF